MEPPRSPLDLSGDRSAEQSGATVTGSALDIDPEAVHVALRSFVQNLVKAERERDDSIAQSRLLECRVRDAEAERQRAEERSKQVSGVWWPGVASASKLFRILEQYIASPQIFR